MLALRADCVPIAIATTSGPPRLAVVHAGWRGLAGGVIEAAVAALAVQETAAVVGPSIGPCCYEVGPEVSARFEPDLTATECSTSGRQPSAPFEVPESRPSSGSTSARAATRSCSSPTAGPGRLTEPRG